MILLVFILFCSYSLFSAMVIRDYCQNEAFSLRCSDKNEILLIERAQYGRMQLSKCLEEEDLLIGNKNDYKFFGCYSEVTDILKTKCSGKLSCDMIITDGEFFTTIDARVCYRSLFSYLKVEYQCVKFYNDEKDCNIEITEEPKQIMLSLQSTQLTSESNIFCGHVTKPYIIEASIGQKININITKIEIIDESYLHNSCVNGRKAIGYLLSGSNKAIRNVSICTDNIIHLNDVLFHEFKIMNASVLKIVLFKWTIDHNTYEDSTKNSIFLKLKAIGCLDLIPPIDAWIQRSNDIVTVGCYSSRQTWKLKCNGYNWLGVIGNCTMFDSNIINIEEKNKHTKYETVDNNSAQVQFSVTVAMCAFALVVCLIIASLCCFLSKRYITTKRKDFDKFPNPTYYPNSINYVIGQKADSPNYNNDERLLNKIENIDSGNEKEEAYFILEDNKL